MSDPVSPSAPQKFSLLRVLAVVIPAALLVVGVIYFLSNKIQADAQAQDVRLALQKLRLGHPRNNRLAVEFTDANNDLVADPPADAAKLVNPDTLIFSYIGGKDSERQKEVWKEFLAAIATATDKKVEYLILETPDKQFAALKSGKLHVTGVATGAVPLAVRDFGFVPDVTFAAADGKIGHTMQLIVPADSKVRKIEDLRGQRISFVDYKSNSGYKAPLILMMNDYNLVPVRDFDWAFTHGHDESIRGIAANEYVAAPVASDMLARATDRGEIKPEQYRVIYESELFPSAALGHVHNLHPDLVAKIKDVYIKFEWSGTGLEKEFSPSGVAKFVPADYKQQWSLIRRIDDALGPDPVIPIDSEFPESEETPAEKMEPEKMEE